jgi:hypothetical protein
MPMCRYVFSPQLNGSSIANFAPFDARMRLGFMSLRACLSKICFTLSAKCSGRALILGIGVMVAMNLTVHQAVAQAPEAPKPLSDNAVNIDTKKHEGFPTWSQFPPPPKDIPTLADIKAKVVEVEGQAKGLQTKVAGLDWELSNPTAFVDQTKSRIDPVLSKPVDMVLSQTEIESFAQALRKKAIPPPIAD